MPTFGRTILFGCALTFLPTACSTTPPGKIKVCQKVPVTGSRLPHVECEYKDDPNAVKQATKEETESKKTANKE